MIEKTVAKTPVGKVESGTKILLWEKVVEGSKSESVSRTWEWSI